MNVGITAHLDRNNFGEGLKQASINLYDCIAASGHNVFYICSSANIIDFNKTHLGYDLGAALECGAPELDVLIFHGFIPDREYVQLILRKSPFCKFVVFHQGNRIAMDSACLSNGSGFAGGVHYADEIWVPPHHKNSEHYLKEIHKAECQVELAPFLWSPFFLDEAVKKTKYRSIRFNKKEKNGAVILEPNANYSKNCIVPLMICDNLNSSNKELLESVSVTNTEKIKEAPFFKEFLTGLSVQKENKLFLSKKWSLPDVLSKWGKYIISHTKDNDLNFLHLECFYLGVPIIHNSKTFAECGYYYESYDVPSGAKQLKKALEEHPNDLVSYLEKGRKLISKFSPSNPVNIEIVNERLEKILKKNSRKPVD